MNYFTHFFLSKDALLTTEYLSILSPTIKSMMEDYLSCRAEYPDMLETWTKSYNFTGPHSL